MYGAGDRGKKSKPNKPAAPSPAVKEAHAKRAQDVAKTGRAKRYIRKAAPDVKVNRGQSTSNELAPAPRTVKVNRGQSESVPTRGLRSRTMLDYLPGMQPAGTRRRSHTDEEEIRFNVAKLFSHSRDAAEKADAADALQRLGIVPGGKKRGPLVIQGTEIPRGPGGGHSGKFHGQIADEKGYLRNVLLDEHGHEIHDKNRALEGLKIAAGLAASLGIGQGKDQTERTLGPAFHPKYSHIVRNTLQSGVTATGGAVMEGLDRPAAASESAVAKGLVAAGVIKGATAAKIKKAPGPGKVFAHGRDWGKDITGADITQGLGLGRKVGVGADLLVDPVMWVGLGLAPETDGASLALVRERIARMAPALLNDARVEKVFKAYDQHGNEKKALRSLRGLIKPRKVAKAQAAENRRVVEDAIAKGTKIKLQVPKRRLRNGLRQRLEVQETHLPGNAPDVVQEALRHGEARKIKPQLRVNLMTPLGRRTPIGLNIPDLGLLGRTPVAMKRSEEAINAARRAARTHMASELNTHMREIDARIAHMERTKQPAEQILAARRDKQAIVDEYVMKTAEAEHAAEDAVKVRTLGDVVSEKNMRSQSIHTARLASQDFGRMTNAKYAQAVERATKVIPFGPERERSLKRVQMYLNTWADTKGVGLKHLAETIGPMTKDEQVAFTNLRRLYRAQGKHDIKNGTLQNTLSDYVGQRLWEEPSSVPGAGKRGMTTSFQQHRGVSAVADFADPHALAEALKELSHGAVSDEHALAAAERLWSQGHVRTVADITRSALLRGNTIMWEDLTQFEKAAIDRAARVGLLHDREVPLFRTPLTHPGETDGQVLFNNSEEAQRAYNLDLGELPDDQRIPQQILSAVADRQRVAEAHANAAGPAKHDLGQIHQRLTDEIQNTELVPWVDKAQEDIHARTRAVNEAEAVIHEPQGELGQPLSTVERRRYARARARAAARGEPVPPPVPARHPMTGGRTPEEQYQLERTMEDEQHLPAERQRISAVQNAIESGDPAALRAVAPGVYTAQADGNGDLWLRGIRNGDAPPIEGITPRPNEALPHADPFNYFSSLPDFRAEPLSGEMVNLDPRAAGYTRARAAGMSAAWHARWQGFDKQYGRSAADELKQVYHLPATGEMGMLDELFAVRDDNGFITGYQRRDDIKSVGRAKAEVHDPSEVEIQKGSLIPDANKEYWINTDTGEEYTSPRRVFESGLMLHNLEEDRLWPTQAIEQLKLDSVRSGELDAPMDALYNDALTKGFQRFMGITRFAVTSPFPAYHIRNLISDLIKSIQADSGVLFHPIVNFKMLAAAAGKGLDWNIKVKGYEKMKMEDFLFMADMFGAKSGHHVAEVSALLHHGDFTNRRAQNLVRHGIFSALTPGGITTKAGAAREDIVRYMTFMQRMRANGGDAADAAWYMTRHHFNYNDLSGVERKYVRNLFLFYTWYRKNIPLQLVELVRRPGFFAGISHTYHALENGSTPFNVGPMSGTAPHQPFLPSYVKDKLLSATTNWNDHALNVGFGAPYADLSFVSTKGVHDIIGLLTPPAALGLQFAFRTDPLTGRRYKEREPSGIASAYNEIYKHITGHDLPLDENGNPTLPWRLSILMRQAPFLGRATYSLGQTSETRDQGRLQEWGRKLGNLTGLNIFVSPAPGSERESAARQKYLTGNIAMERRQVQEDLSNFPTDSGFYKQALSEQDKRAIQFLREHGLPLSALQDIKNSGYYQGQVRVKRGGLGGGGMGGTLGGGTLGGGR